MYMKDLDGGIHTDEDFHRKFKSTIVYARPNKLTEEPCPIFIRHVEDDRVFYQTGWNSSTYEAYTSDFDILSLRPRSGIYNHVESNRPFHVQQIPARQWRIGWCEENISVCSVKQQAFSPYNVNLEGLKCFFEPVYPSIPDAVKLLINGSHKHVAINSSVSILKGNSRFVVLKDFIPFMTISNGMFFKVPPSDQILKKDYQLYADLLRDFF